MSFFITSCGPFTVNGGITFEPLAQKTYAYVNLSHGIATSTFPTITPTQDSAIRYTAASHPNSSNILSYVYTAETFGTFERINSLDIIDENGNIINSVHVNSTNLYNAIPIISTDVGGNIFVGYGISNTSLPSANISDHSIIIEKYTPSLTREWRIISGTNNYEVITHLLPDDQGGVVFGYSRGRFNGYIIHLLSNGAKDWERKINNLSYVPFQATTSFSAGVYYHDIRMKSPTRILLAISYYGPTIGNSNLEFREQLVAEIDINSNQLIWQNSKLNRTIRNNLELERAGTLEVDSEGNLYVFSLDTDTSKKLIITKYSSVGVIEWARSLVPATYVVDVDVTYIQSNIYIDEDNHVWFLTYEIPPRGFDPPSGVLLYHIDPQGNLVESKLISTSAISIRDMRLFVKGEYITIVYGAPYISDTVASSNIIRAPKSVDITLNNGISVTDRSTANDSWEVYADGTDGIRIYTDAPLVSTNDIAVINENLSTQFGGPNLENNLRTTDTYRTSTSSLSVNTVTPVLPPFDPCVRLPQTFDFLPLWWGSGRSLDATKEQYFIYQWKFDNPSNLTSIPSNDEWNSSYDTYLDRKTAGWFATTGTTNYGFMMLGQRRMFSTDIDFDYSNAGQEVNGSYRTHIVQENQQGETSEATFVGYIENTQLADASISCSRDFWRGTTGRNTNLISPPKDFGIAFGTYDSPENINFGQKTISQAQATASTNSTTTWKTHQRYASTASVKSRISVLTLPNQLGSIVAWYDYKAGDSKPHMLRITAFDIDDNVRWAQTLEKSADTGGSFRPEWAPMQEKIGLTHDKQGNIYLTTDWYQPNGVSGYELMTYKIAYSGELLWKKGLSLAADRTFSYSGTLQNIIGHSTEVEDGGNIITAALRPLSAKPYTALMIIKRDTNGNLLNYHSVKIGGQATYGSMGQIYTDRLFIRSPQIVYAGGSAGSFMVMMNSLNMSNTGSHTIDNLTTYSGTDNRSGASNKFQPFVIAGTISDNAISFSESWHFYVINGSTTLDNSDLIYTDAFPTTINHPYTNGSSGPLIAKFTLARSSTNQYPVIISLPYGTTGGANFIRKEAYGTGYIQIADDEREEYVYWWNQNVINLSNSNSGVDTGSSRPFNIENSKDLNVLVQTDYPAKYVSRTVAARPEWTSVTKNRFKTGPTFKRTTSAFDYFNADMDLWLRQNWGYYTQSFTNLGVGNSQITKVIKPYDTDF